MPNIGEDFVIIITTTATTTTTTNTVILPLFSWVVSR